MSLNKGKQAADLQVGTSGAPPTAERTQELLSKWLKANPHRSHKKLDPEVRQHSTAKSDGLAYCGGYNPVTTQHWLTLKIMRSSDLGAIQAEIEALLPHIKPFGKGADRRVLVYEFTHGDFGTYDLAMRPDGSCWLAFHFHGSEKEEAAFEDLPEALDYVQRHHYWEHWGETDDDQPGSENPQSSPATTSGEASTNKEGQS